jgi:hypothetical protein
VLVTANVVPSSPILVTLMLTAIRSSETSVLTRATRRNIPEDASPSVTSCICFDAGRCLPRLWLASKRRDAFDGAVTLQ